MKRTTFVLLALIVAAACSSGGGGISANIPKPKVQIIARTNLSETAPTVPSGINATYEIAVTNNAEIPITLKRVDLDSMAGGGFSLQSRSRQYDMTIAPGETRSVDFTTAAYISDPNSFDARQPVAVRATAYFDSAEGKLSTIVQQRVSIYSGN